MKITGETSDGYHTFNELDEHRIRLFITVCKLWRKNVWVSTLHADGSSYQDWFIMGINKAPGTQVSYHLPARFWSEVCEFAEVCERSPEWDGHTPNDVVKRLAELV